LGDPVDERRDKGEWSISTGRRFALSILLLAMFSTTLLAQLTSATGSSNVGVAGNDSAGQARPLPLAPETLVVDSGDAQKPQSSLHVFPVDRTPVFSAVLKHTSPSATTSLAVVEVATDATFSQVAWASGWVEIHVSGVNVTSDNIGYSGPGLAADTTYYWRVKYRDSYGSETPWSTEHASFRTSAELRDRTLVTTDILRSQTWLNAGSPYMVSPTGSMITVKHGATLILDDRDGDVWLEWNKTIVLKIGDGSAEPGHLVAKRKYDNVSEKWTVRIPDLFNSLLYVSQTGTLTTLDSRTAAELDLYGGRPLSHESYFAVDTVWQGGGSPSSPGLIDFSAHTGGSLALLDATNTSTTGPWGRVGDDQDGNQRTHGPHVHPLLNSSSRVIEQIGGTANYDEYGNSAGVYYGEIDEDWSNDASKWKDLMRRMHPEPGASDYGIQNCAYAVAGPGWRTSIEAHARIYLWINKKFKENITREATSTKVLGCWINAESGFWLINYNTRLYVQAGSTNNGGEAAALAYAHQLLYAASGKSQHNRNSRVAVCEYSDDWFTDVSHPWIKKAEQGDLRTISVSLSGGGDVPSTSKEVDDSWANYLPSGYKGGFVDIYTRDYASIVGDWTTEGEDLPKQLQVVYGDRGWVYVHNDEIGEVSAADVQHAKLYGVYEPRKLLRVELRRQDPETGEWETVASMDQDTPTPVEGGVETEDVMEGEDRDVTRNEYEKSTGWGSADPVVKITWVDSATGEVIAEVTGPEYTGDDNMYLDEVDEYENVRVVRVWQKERNVEFKHDKYWSVQVESKDDTVEPPETIAVYKFD